MKGLRCLGTKLASFPGAERACGRGEKGAVQRWQPFFSRRTVATTTVTAMTAATAAAAATAAVATRRGVAAWPRRCGAHSGDDGDDGSGDDGARRGGTVR